MATESRPKQGGFSLINYVVRSGASIDAVTSEAVRFPSSNLLTQDRSKRWHSTSKTTAVDIDLTLSEEITPKILAFINSNFFDGTSFGGSVDVAAAAGARWVASDMGDDPGYDDGDSITDDWKQTSGTSLPLNIDFINPGSNDFIASDISGSDGSAVSVWPGGGPDLAQATASKQPKLRTNFLGYLSGKSAVQFDGNDVLQLSSEDGISINDCIIVAIVRMNDSTQRNVILGSDSGTLFEWTGTSMKFTDDGGNSVEQVPWSSIFSGQFYLFSFSRTTSGVCQFHIDGFQQGTDQTMGSVGTVSFRYLGGDNGTPSNGLSGYLAGITIDGNYTAARRIRIESSYAYYTSLAFYAHAPTYVNDGSNFNGWPFVRFNGTTQSLFIGGGTPFPDGQSNTTTIVFSVDTLASDQYIIAGAASWIIATSTSIKYEDTGQTVTWNHSLTTGEPHVLTFIRSPNSAKLFVDGSLIDGTKSIVSASRNPHDFDFLGGRYTSTAFIRTFDGDVAEVITHTYALPEHEAYNLHNELVDKYGISASSKVIALKRLDGASGNVLQTFTFDLKSQSDNRILHYYIGNDDNGTACGASRYWRISLSKEISAYRPEIDGIDDFHEIGVIWLGKFTEVDIGEDLREVVVDPSRKSYSVNRSEYTDQKITYSEIDLKLPVVTIDKLFSIKSELDEIGNHTFGLLDIFAASTDAVKQKNGIFYGTFAEERGGGADLEHDQNTWGKISIDFREVKD